LLGQHLFFKAHLALFEVGLPLLSVAFGLLLNGRFQLLDTVQKFLNLRFHGGLLGSARTDKKPALRPPLAFVKTCGHWRS
jgi:hypothetical protein